MESEDVFESLDDIISTSDAEFQTIPAWGGKKARIGSVTAGQMITFLENNDKPEKKRENGLMLIALSLVDKKDQRLVDTSNPESLATAIAKLRNKDSKINGKVVEKILLLNGLTKVDAAALAKNASGETPTGGSPTV